MEEGEELVGLVARGHASELGHHGEQRAHVVREFIREGELHEVVEAVLLSVPHRRAVGVLVADLRPVRLAVLALVRERADGVGVIPEQRAAVAFRKQTAHGPVCVLCPGISRAEDEVPVDREATLRHVEVAVSLEPELRHPRHLEVGVDRICGESGDHCRGHSVALVDKLVVEVHLAASAV